ncbi:MAG: peptidoglycan-binding protein [Labrys sp. (in: a-proteobacteria)]
MREALARSNRDFVLEDNDALSHGRLRLLLRILLERPIEVAGAIAMTGVAGLIMANALFLQEGQHPAPLFRAVAAAAKPDATPAIVRPAQSPELTALVRAIQTELTARGHDIGAIDGMMGPKTDAAIRAFQRHAGLSVDGAPTASLLTSLKAARIAPPSDAIGELIVTQEPPRNPRVLFVERTLAKYGYGRLKIDGVLDTATREAIERFERERGLTPTGTVTDRLITELEGLSAAPSP